MLNFLEGTATTTPNQGGSGLLTTILMLAYIIHVLNVLNLGDNIRGDLQ